MRWSKDAMKEMERVPFFLRKMVKGKVEEFARRQGSQLVIPDHLEACRRRFMENQEPEVRGYRLETCFGARECTNRVLGPTDLVERLDELFSSLDLKAFLHQRVSGLLKMHHEFRVSMSFCPNACSRPQIADLGIIGAVGPEITDEACCHCRECLQECREGAISLAEGQTPVIHEERCLYCGHCTRVCPTSTLKAGREGFRLLAGGKLGRHPRLGHELPGIFSEDEVIEKSEKIIDFYRSECSEGERLGAILDRIGLESLYRFIEIPLGG